MVAVAASFSPAAALLGGLAIGSATAAHALLLGRVTGISGHLTRTLLGSVPSDVLLLGGLLFGGILAPPSVADALPLQHHIVFIAGFFVSLGSSLSNGCTSGHGVCDVLRPELNSHRCESERRYETYIYSYKCIRPMCLSLLTSSCALLAICICTSFSAQVCGLARGSPRSLVAVCTFMATAGMVARGAGTASALGSVAALDANDVRFIASLTGTTAVSLLATTICSALLPRKSSIRAFAVGASQFLIGALFAGGLIASQMAVPGKVASFFDVGRPSFDPSLAFVFPGALPIAALAFHHVRTKKSSPVMVVAEDEIQIPAPSSHVDMPLVLGAAVFGVGWALAGVCPGPAVVLLGNSLSSASATLPKIATWFLGYGTGVFAYRRLA
jgi:uncharacterized protein